MSIERLPAQVKKYSAFRTWFPWIVAALTAGGIALLWLWPAPDLERVWRVVGTQVFVMLGGILVLAWMVSLSYWPRVVRRGIFLAVVVALLGVGASIKDVHFTGDIYPIITWRWSRDGNAILEEHRRLHGGVVVAPVVLTDLPSDFPEYRGRRRDGVVTGPPLARDWTAHPPRLLWKQPIGGGYAQFAVAGNLAVTIEQRRGDEAVVGYDATSSGERWVYSYSALFSERMGGDGPRATPTIAEARVYSLGATGRLVCLDAATGRRLWETDTLEGDNLPWGISGSPLVYDRFVVVNPGKQGGRGHTLVAYDRMTGQKVWASGEARAGYSSPMLATLAGVRQILLFDGERLAGYAAGTGQELWHFDWPTNQDINVAQPLVLAGDRVFISSGYGVGSAMLQITQTDGRWEPKKLWRKRTRTLRCRFTSPVAYAGHIYGLDEGVLTCLNQETGDLNWHEGQYGHGQVLLAGDLLLVLAENGRLALVEANPRSYRELGCIAVFDAKTWNCPALANGKAYLRNDQEMACYDLTAGEGAKHP
jgi:outer membrane protein assembly factor BamB